MSENFVNPRDPVPRATTPDLGKMQNMSETIFWHVSLDGITYFPTPERKQILERMTEKEKSLAWQAHLNRFELNRQPAGHIVQNNQVPRTPMQQQCDYRNGKQVPSQNFLNRYDMGCFPSFYPVPTNYFGFDPSTPYTATPLVPPGFQPLGKHRQQEAKAINVEGDVISHVSGDNPEHEKAAHRLSSGDIEKKIADNVPDIIIKESTLDHQHAAHGSSLDNIKIKTADKDLEITFKEPTIEQHEKVQTTEFEDNRTSEFEENPTKIENNPLETGKETDEDTNSQSPVGSKNVKDEKFISEESNPVVFTETSMTFSKSELTVSSEKNSETEFRLVKKNKRTKKLTAIAKNVIPSAFTIPAKQEKDKKETTVVSENISSIASEPSTSVVNDLDLANNSVEKAETVKKQGLEHEKDEAEFLPVKPNKRTEKSTEITSNITPAKEKKSKKETTVVHENINLVASEPSTINDSDLTKNSNESSDALTEKISEVQKSKTKENKKTKEKKKNKKKMKTSDHRNEDLQNEDFLCENTQNEVSNPENDHSTLITEFYLSPEQDVHEFTKEERDRLTEKSNEFDVIRSITFFRTVVAHGSLKDYPDLRKVMTRFYNLLKPCTEVNYQMDDEEHSRVEEGGKQMDVIVLDAYAKQKILRCSSTSTIFYQFDAKVAEYFEGKRKFKHQTMEQKAKQYLEKLLQTNTDYLEIFKSVKNNFHEIFIPPLFYLYLHSSDANVHSIENAFFCSLAKAPDMND